jgi:hypothetical protein
MKRTLTKVSPEITRSISFSGAGFMGSYHCGAIKALQEAGILPDLTDNHRLEKRHRDIVFLGSSAGSLVSAGVLTGQPVDELMDVCHLLSSVAGKVSNGMDLVGCPPREILLISSPLFMFGSNPWILPLLALTSWMHWSPTSRHISKPEGPTFCPR